MTPGSRSQTITLMLKSCPNVSFCESWVLLHDLLDGKAILCKALDGRDRNTGARDYPSIMADIAGSADLSGTGISACVQLFCVALRVCNYSFQRYSDDILSTHNLTIVPRLWFDEDHLLVKYKQLCFNPLRIGKMGKILSDVP